MSEGIAPGPAMIRRIRHGAVRNRNVNATDGSGRHKRSKSCQFWRVFGTVLLRIHQKAYRGIDTCTVAAETIRKWSDGNTNSGFTLSVQPAAEFTGQTRWQNRLKRRQKMTNQNNRRGRMMPPSKIALWMEIADHLEMRANDPWPDHLWPAANEVLTDMAAELRRKATSSDGSF